MFRVPRTLAGKTTGLIEEWLPNIAVTVSRDGATHTVATDAGGGFRVDNPGAGTYRISVEVPDRFYSDAPVTTVMLRDPRSCADVGVALHDNGRLTGRVVDSAGRPVAGLTLDLGTAGSGQARLRPASARLAVALAEAAGGPLPAATAATRWREFRPDVSC